MNHKYAIIITTIQNPTKAVLEWRRRLPEIPFIVIGDEKGPQEYHVSNHFYSYRNQIDLDFELARKLPTKSYTRKNLGYLIAAKMGIDAIYETDDDNYPLPSWKPWPDSTFSGNVSENQRWVNVYSYFTKENVWPRGLPLDRINQKIEPKAASNRKALVYQDLANGSPDVDAVWRLTQNRDITFEKNCNPIFLGRNSWCPFNSQATWWFKEAFFLLYLPRYCSFRMTDIWRGLIAQRCLWEINSGITFRGAHVFQDRNEHDLMDDFRDEVPGYLKNHEIMTCLAEIKFKNASNHSDLILECYIELVRKKIFPEDELKLLKSWLIDLRRALSNESKQDSGNM